MKKLAQTLRNFVRPGAQVGPCALDGSSECRLDEAPASGEEGMATAEYAIGTLAAAAFAGLLLAIFRDGGAIKDTIQSLIESALSVS